MLSPPQPMARAVLLSAALAYLGAALDDDAMAACLRCVNWSCEGNEPHSEICSDCLGEDCDECRDAIGNSELAAFVSGGCNFYDGSEVGNWFRDEACGSLRGCCPITRDFCTNDPYLPDNCDCGDCGYPACGDCDCDRDHYSDGQCCSREGEGCYSEWPAYPGDHPYDTFTNSGKCSRMKDWAADLAHNEDVGTVANIAECWSRCQDLNEPRKTSYCASMHQTTMECSCQGADLDGAFEELECLEDVGEYTLAVHKDWRGSPCYGSEGSVCGCEDEDYCLPYGACCIEHMFSATGRVEYTTCFGSWNPWDPVTMTEQCTAGHSDAGAVAPAFRDCSQAAIDAGSCGTGDWDTCADCEDFGDWAVGMYWANVGYTSCPGRVVVDMHEEAADGGQCETLITWTTVTDVYTDTGPAACSFELWRDLIRTDGGKKPWFVRLGVFALFSLVCLPFTVSFLALPTFAERAGPRVDSIWRWWTVGLTLLCFLGFYWGPYTLICFLVVMGYTTAVVTEERVKLGAFCSVIILITVYPRYAIAFVVLGCSTVAFAPRSGEREKVRSAVFMTKASAAADRGRLPRWACCVYFCATVTFIALASSRVFTTNPSTCSPCNCINDKLIDCYADAKTIVWTDSHWNRKESYLPTDLELKKMGIKAIEPGAFEGMATLEKLILRKNRISTIEPKTFKGLNKIWKLDLGKNKIQVVESNAFLGLHRLHLLELNNNQIVTLEADAFLGLHNLRYLELNGNQIIRIEDGAFDGLENLDYLNLDGNPVTCDDAYAADLPPYVDCRGGTNTSRAEVDYSSAFDDD